jgi:hypothetical protein
MSKNGIIIILFSTVFLLFAVGGVIIFVAGGFGGKWYVVSNYKRIYSYPKSLTEYEQCFRHNIFWCR